MIDYLILHVNNTVYYILSIYIYFVVHKTVHKTTIKKRKYSEYRKRKKLYLKNNRERSKKKKQRRKKKSKKNEAVQMINREKPGSQCDVLNSSIIQNMSMY